MAGKDKVKQGKDTKQGKDKKKAKDAKGRTSSGKKVPEKSIPPSSTQDPNSKMARRKSQGDIISTFQGQLDSKEDEHVKEQRRTIEKIRILRKDNERIQRKQEAEFGMTLDMLEELKYTLEKTKTSNQKLYEDMEESKTLHDKLELELKAARQKFRDAEAQCEEFHKETKVWNETKVKFAKTEARIRDLREANKKLRFILLSNHIDHHADAKQLTTKPQEDHYPVKTNHTYPKISLRHLTTRSRFELAGTIDKIRTLSAEELKRKYGITRANLDQVSPAYLGFYLKRKRKSLLHLEPLRNPPRDIQHTYYRPGVTLPRVDPRQYDRLTLE